MIVRTLTRAWIAATALLLTACASAPLQQAPSAAIASDSALQAPRLITLEGAQNFRDIGGYRTADGKRVKWGLIYRSAALSGLTASDVSALDSLSVQRVYDLRSTTERRAAPDAWTGPGAPSIIAHDYETNAHWVGSALRTSPTAESVRTAMEATYPDMLTILAPDYRDLFANLLEGQGATLYHCTAGKDRTGIATALILSALGVPRETIYADYLMSNRFYRPSAGAFPSLPPEVLQALLGVDERYLRAAFTAIDTQYGSVEGYLDQALGVDAAGIARLRALYTE
jgi:protein-tyrosine phosphatase